VGVGTHRLLARGGPRLNTLLAGDMSGLELVDRHPQGKIVVTVESA
jgi:hypothetical protein